MGRGTKEAGDQVRAFARAHRVSLPTARKYRRDPVTGEPRREWVEWLRASAAPGAGGGLQRVAQQKKAGTSEWERAEQAREAAWRALEKIQRSIEHAGDEELPALARALRMQRKTYEEACVHAEKAKVKAGQLIPRAALENVTATLIAPLNDAFKALKNSVAGRIPQQHRAEFYNAWQASLPGWQHAVAALDAGFEKILRESC